MTAFDDGTDPMMSDINMTPLVDVMLVLLIIFIITIPVIRHSVKLELPRASSVRDTIPPQAVAISVDASGQVSWNGEPIDDARLGSHLQHAATLQPPPELRLQGDRAVRYERIAEVMAAARGAGLSRIAFVSLPSAVGAGTGVVTGTGVGVNVGAGGR